MFFLLFFPNNSLKRQVSFTVGVLEHMGWYLDHKGLFLWIFCYSQAECLKGQFKTFPNSEHQCLLWTIEFHYDYIRPNVIILKFNRSIGKKSLKIFLGMSGWTGSQSASCPLSSWFLAQGHLISDCLVLICQVTKLHFLSEDLNSINGSLKGVFVFSYNIITRLF